MSYNRVQLTTRLQNYFNNPAYYQPIDFNDSIQDGLDEVVAFSGCVYNTATIPFSAGVTYYDMLALLPDYIGVVAVYNATMNRWMLPTSLSKLRRARWDWEVAGGTPYWFVPINFRYMAIYLKPLAPLYGNMYVFYRASAPQLNDSTVIPIPDDHIEALEKYVLSDLWEQNQEFTKSGAQFKDYQAEIQKLYIYIESKRNPGRQQRLMG